MFKLDGTLVRTLWSAQSFGAGTFTRVWDGTDDYGKKLATPDPTYQIKIVSNNVSYQWEGVIGNSSSAQSGPTVHRGYYHCMQALTFANNTGFYAQGYSEGTSSVSKFDIADPQSKTTIFASAKTTLDTDYNATDGNYVYWSGTDAYAPANSMVTATKVSDDSEVVFTNGVAYPNTYGKLYASAIDRLNVGGSKISGLAVQKTGKYLFVAHSALNELHVLDKATGALVQKLTYTTPKSLAVDSADNLWMATATNTVAQYRVASDGTLSAPVLTLSGLLDPMAIQVSPDGTTVLVADGDISQQVKAFKTGTGLPVWTLGQSGGYWTDATVANDKFMFSDALGKLVTFIAFQPDGSFWVGDPGNFRAMHYNSNRIFIDRVMSMGSNYVTNVDKNNISRVFSSYLEFNVDYSKPLSGSSGWTLVKNWGANVTAAYDYRGLANVTTLSNNRTYGLFRKGSAREIVEFQPTGTMRFSGVMVSGTTGINNQLEPSGALTAWKGASLGGNGVISQYAFAGFDANNNPKWSTTATVLATTPPYQYSDPNPNAAPGVTTTGKVIFYLPDTVATWTPATTPGGRATPNQYFTGYHLGAIQQGSNNWRWKTEQQTHRNYMGAYPGPGFFDVGNLVNDYAGSQVNVVDRNVITGYHGEFWKNSQTNKYNHYLDNGLAIGQFGTTRPETVGVAAPMMAGNALTPVVVKAPNGDLYLWHGDESDHAGVHRWKISNLASIAEQAVTIPYPTTYNRPTNNYVDLMAGVAFDQPLADGSVGWTRNPAQNAVIKQYYDSWLVNSSILKYDRFTSPDIQVSYVASTRNTSIVSRDLGTNNVANSWRVYGEVAYPSNMPNSGAIFQYLEILDAAGKVIATLAPEYLQTTTPKQVMYKFNGQILAAGVDTTMKSYMQSHRNLDISATANGVNVIYGNYAPKLLPVSDPTADWRTPKSLRLRFENIGNGYPAYGVVIDLKDFKFDQN